jgi:hypothetical protein
MNVAGISPFGAALEGCVEYSVASNPHLVASSGDERREGHWAHPSTPLGMTVGAGASARYKMA